MKITELQINDLVRVTDDDTNEVFVGRVTALDLELGNVSVKRKGEETAYPFSIDCIEGIPTTSEILEKNGWRYNDIPFIDGWEQFGLTIRDGKIVCGQNIAADVSSIHRLQQFLTICGIEKEIALDGISVKEG